MKLSLPNITICAADSSTPSLAARAISESMALCDFGAAMLFTDQPSHSDKFQSIRIGKLNSREDYSRFVLKDLLRFVATPFVLIVQWDGYVLDNTAWQPAYLQYDLIGAKWHWHKDGMTVGNGGFTLRSRKLLAVMADPAFPFLPDVNEDDQICRVYRPRLAQDFGIRFAPEAIADTFSYERSLPDFPTFGFHGLFNLWRHVEDDDLVEMASIFTPNIIGSIEFLELLLHYSSMRKFQPLRHLYTLLRRYSDPETIHAAVSKLARSPEFAAHFVRVCENLLQTPGPPSAA